MRVEIDVRSVAPLRFADGSLVRAASAVAPFGDGWLIAQDDATHAAWLRNETVTAVRVVPSVEGLDVFEQAAGTKHLKPDFEAACAVGAASVVFLGSGSSPARMRASLVTLQATGPQFVVTDLSVLYAAVARTLAVEPDELNLEGACVVGEALRWFHRGLPAAGLPAASVDLDLPALLAAVGQGADMSAVRVSDPRHYDLGELDGVGLAVTDSVPAGGDLLLVSAAAEDTPNPRDDGPVTGSALALLDGAEVRDLAVLPAVDGKVAKVEGLGIVELDRSGALVLATIDADDPRAPSPVVELAVRW